MRLVPPNRRVILNPPEKPTILPGAVFGLAASSEKSSQNNKKAKNSKKKTPKKGSKPKGTDPFQALSDAQNTHETYVRLREEAGEMAHVLYWRLQPLQRAQIKRFASGKKKASTKKDAEKGTLLNSKILAFLELEGKTINTKNLSQAQLKETRAWLASVKKMRKRAKTLGSKLQKARSHLPKAKATIAGNKKLPKNYRQDYANHLNLVQKQLKGVDLKSLEIVLDRQEKLLSSINPGKKKLK